MHALIANPDVQFVFWAFVKIFIILNGLLVVVSYMIYAERKICGRMQGRYGPNRVGWYGLMQPWADVVKLILQGGVHPGRGEHGRVTASRPRSRLCPR